MNKILKTPTSAIVTDEQLKAVFGELYTNIKMAAGYAQCLVNNFEKQKAKQLTLDSFELLSEIYMTESSIIYNLAKNTNEKYKQMLKQRDNLRVLDFNAYKRKRTVKNAAGQ